MFWKLALTSPAASVPDERSVSLSCAQPVCSAPAAFAWPGEKPAGDCPLSFAESLKLALVLKALLVEEPVPLSATCPVTVVVAVVVSLTSAVEETPPGRYGLEYQGIALLGWPWPPELGPPLSAAGGLPSAPLEPQSFPTDPLTLGGIHSSLVSWNVRVVELVVRVRKFAVSLVGAPSVTVRWPIRTSTVFWLLSTVLFQLAVSLVTSLSLPLCLEPAK